MFGNESANSLLPDLFLFLFCRILGSCTSLMQAIQVLIVASKDLQREIVESGRVSVREACGGRQASATTAHSPQGWSPRCSRLHSVESQQAAISSCVHLGAAATTVGGSRCHGEK